MSSKVASSSTVAKKARTGSAASVFRGRPEAAEGGAAVVGNSSMAAAAAAAAAADDDDDDDSPQKILLSLRTPTTSFEDNKNKKMSPPDSLSPTVPPGAQRSPEQLFEVRTRTRALEDETWSRESMNVCGIHAFTHIGIICLVFL